MESTYVSSFLKDLDLSRLLNRVCLNATLCMHFGLEYFTEEKDRTCSKDSNGYNSRLANLCYENITDLYGGGFTKDVHRLLDFHKMHAIVRMSPDSEKP